MSLRSFVSRACTHRGGAMKFLQRNPNFPIGSLSSVEAASSFQRNYSSTPPFSKPESTNDGDVHQPSPPTLSIAKSMPSGLSQMDNDALWVIAAMGHHEAGCEVLKRHIMAVDEIDYAQATDKYDEIAEANRGVLNIAVLPYIAGISLGMCAAVASLPMVFDLNTALLFNKDFVTTDVPEPRDLETMLEVGSWTWNWMEPPLGTLSFVLLCLQFARGQIKNLGLHPYTTGVRNRRAERLAATYPQYNAEVLRQFSFSDPLVGSVQTKN